MSRENQDLDLLAACRDALEEDVLPHLEGAPRQVAQRIEKALRIVCRKIALTETSRTVDQALADIAPEGLMQALRSGSCDARPEIHAALWTAASVDTAAAKPGALTRQERALAGLP